MKGKRLLCLALTVALLAGCFAGTASAEAEKNDVTDGAGEIVPVRNRVIAGPQEKDFTLMVYIVGADLESESGLASGDIGEMLAADVDYSKTNIILYTGGATAWQSGIPAGCNTVLELSAAGPTVAGQTEAPANMGDASTFYSFLDFAYSEYPAQRYGLICWDHGGGPVWGYGADEWYDDDTLLLPELQLALEASPFGPDNKLAFIGYDACLMASLEVAYLWKDYADYLVASAEIEGGNGWDYSFLSSLGQTDDTPQLARAIIDAYASYAESSSGMLSLLADYYGLDAQSLVSAATLSCMDLGQVDETVAAMDALFARAEEGLGEGEYLSLAQARSGLKAYGQESADLYDLVDLGDLAEKMEPIYGEEAQALSEAVDSLIIYSTSNVENCSGVSVYYPYHSVDLYTAIIGTVYRSAAASERYAEYLDEFISWRSNSGAASASRSLLPVEEQTDAMTMQLTREQIAEMSEAYYTVFRQPEEGGYTPILMRCRLVPDENGVLHVPKDQNVITFSNGGWEEIYLPVRQLGQENGKTRYATVNAYFLGNMYEMAITPLYMDEATAIISVNNTSGQAALEELRLSQEDPSVAGKTDVDVSRWDYFGPSFVCYLPGSDAAGEPLPYTQWERSAGIWWSYSELRAPLEVDAKPWGACDEPLYCQVVVEDIYGNEYASELVQVSKGAEVTEREVATEAGAMTFSVYADHAVLTRYTGDDTRLEVPGQVDGVPVTIIESRSIVGNELKQIVFPDTVLQIGNTACNAWSVETITLPASVQHICVGAFSACGSLREFVLEGDNDQYQVIDGVLFTKDGACLMAYPPAKGTSYVIPEGVETIAFNAFNGAEELTHVQFPDSLRRIGNFAFYSCNDLSGLELPAGLEWIGTQAFGVYFGLMLFNGIDWFEDEELVDMDTVRISGDVTYIGAGAFNGVGLQAFEVAADNPVYSARDGFLMNKQGDVLIGVPHGRAEVRVPEGTVTIRNHTFSYDSYITDVYIPDSVINIEPNAFDSGYGDRVTIHGGAGSAAEEYALENEMAFAAE